MTEAEEIVQVLLDADQENTKLFTSFPDPHLSFIREEYEDDDEDIKAILGPDYYDPKPKPDKKIGSVDRHGRWANIRVGDNLFCISYLTPVAVHVPGEGLLITDRDWSTTTSQHIGKWAAEIGMTAQHGVPYRYADLKKRFKRIPQDELNKMFREQASQVDWSKKDMRRATSYRSPMGFKHVDADDRIDLRPYEEPKEEI